MGTYGNAILGLGYNYPDFMDAIMPLASLPLKLWKKQNAKDMVAKLIEMDPELGKKGEYKAQTNSGSVWEHWSINVYGE
jgi:hypothetical protein